MYVKFLSVFMGCVIDIVLFTKLINNDTGRNGTSGKIEKNNFIEI